MVMDKEYEKVRQKIKHNKYNKINDLIFNRYLIQNPYFEKERLKIALSYKLLFDRLKIEHPFEYEDMNGDNFSFLNLYTTREQKQQIQKLNKSLEKLNKQEIEYYNILKLSETINREDGTQTNRFVHSIDLIKNIFNGKYDDITSDYDNYMNIKENAKKNIDDLIKISEATKKFIADHQHEPLLIEQFGLKRDNINLYLKPKTYSSDDVIQEIMKDEKTPLLDELRQELEILSNIQNHIENTSNDVDFLQNELITKINEGYQIDYKEETEELLNYISILKDTEVKKNLKKGNLDKLLYEFDNRSLDELFTLVFEDKDINKKAPEIYEQALDTLYKKPNDELYGELKEHYFLNNGYWLHNLYRKSNRYNLNETINTEKARDDLNPNKYTTKEELLKINHIGNISLEETRVLAYYQAKDRIDNTYQYNKKFNTLCNSLNAKVKSVGQALNQIDIGYNTPFSNLKSVLQGVESKDIKNMKKFEEDTRKYLEFLDNLKLSANMVNFLEYYRVTGNKNLGAKAFRFLANILNGTSFLVMDGFLQESMFGVNNPLRRVFSLEEYKFRKEIKNNIINPEDADFFLHGQRVFKNSINTEVNKEVVEARQSLNDVEDLNDWLNKVTVNDTETKEEISEEEKELEKVRGIIGEEYTNIYKSILQNDVITKNNNGFNEQIINNKNNGTIYNNLVAYLKSIDINHLRKFNASGLESTNEDYKKFLNTNGFTNALMLKQAGEDCEMLYMFSQIMNDVTYDNELNSKLHEKIKYIKNYLKENENGIASETFNKKELLDDISLKNDRNEVINLLDYSDLEEKKSNVISMINEKYKNNIGEKKQLINALTSTYTDMSLANQQLYIKNVLYDIVGKTNASENKKDIVKNLNFELYINNRDTYGANDYYLNIKSGNKHIQIIKFTPNKDVIIDGVKTTIENSEYSLINNYLKLEKGELTTESKNALLNYLLANNKSNIIETVINTMEDGAIRNIYNKNKDEIRQKNIDNTILSSLLTYDVKDNLNPINVVMQANHSHSKNNNSKYEFKDLKELAMENISYNNEMREYLSYDDYKFIIDNENKKEQIILKTQNDKTFKENIQTGIINALNKEKATRPQLFDEILNNLDVNKIIVSDDLENEYNNYLQEINLYDGESSYDIINIYNKAVKENVKRIVGKIENKSRDLKAYVYEIERNTFIDNLDMVTELQDYNIKPKEQEDIEKEEKDYDLLEIEKEEKRIEKELEEETRKNLELEADRETYKGRMF